MYIDKSPLFEKTVDGERERRSQPEKRPKCVGPGPQVGNGSEKFEAVMFFLERIIFIDSAVDDDLFGPQLHRLTGGGRDRENALDSDSAAGPQPADFIITAHARLQNDLQTVDARAVVNRHKGNVFTGPYRSDPAFDDQSGIYGLAVQYGNDAMMIAHMTSRYGYSGS